MVPLGEVAEIERNSVLPAKIAAGTKYVGLEHIESGGGELRFARVANGELSSNKFRFGPSHVLYGKLRPYLAKIVCPDFEGICSTDIIPIAPGSEVDRRYLLHYLRLPKVVDWASSRATGINLPRLSPRQLSELEIPLPPLAEQRRIAAILDKADALRRKRRQALDLLDSLTQSIFLEMFGDPIQNNYAWPTLAAGDLCRRLTVGIVVRPASYYRSSGIPAIRSINIRENDFEMNDVVFVSADDNEGVLSKSRIFQGDIVIVRTGQPGKAAVVPRELDGANAIDILIASPKPAIIHSHYLCDLLNSSAGKALALHGKRGQIQQHLNVGTLKSALLPVPPLTLQAEYMKRKVALNELKSAARASLASTDSLFTSLQSRAFSGQL
jgi:type I restriction enzyme S subunit